MPFRLAENVYIIHSNTVFLLFWKATPLSPFGHVDWQLNRYSSTILYTVLWCPLSFPLRKLHLPFVWGHLPRDSTQFFRASKAHKLQGNFQPFTVKYGIVRRRNPEWIRIGSFLLQYSTNSIHLSGILVGEFMFYLKQLWNTITRFQLCLDCPGNQKVERGGTMGLGYCRGQLSPDPIWLFWLSLESLVIWNFVVFDSNIWFIVIHSPCQAVFLYIFWCQGCVFGMASSGWYPPEDLDFQELASYNSRYFENYCFISFQSLSSLQVWFNSLLLDTYTYIYYILKKYECNYVIRHKFHDAQTYSIHYCPLLPPAFQSMPLSALCPETRCHLSQSHHGPLHRVSGKPRLSYQRGVHCGMGCVHLGSSWLVIWSRKELGGVWNSYIIAKYAGCSFISVKFWFLFDSLQFTYILCQHSFWVLTWKAKWGNHAFHFHCISR